MRRIFMFVAALSLALFATSSMAQTITTGSIEGLVTDPNGAAVKGATVTATSPNLISAKTANTGDDGRYQILALPPGNYKISINAGGFAKFESADFAVNLGRTSTADATLQLQTTTSVVNVTSGAAVDAAQNTTGSNVSTDQFSNFPTQRTVQGLYTIAPTVTRSGLRDAAGRDRDPSVAGSSGPENNYILDGVNTTDPAFGGAGANLPFEFVQVWRHLLSCTSAQLRQAAEQQGHSQARHVGDELAAILDDAEPMSRWRPATTGPGVLVLASFQGAAAA